MPVAVASTDDASGARLGSVLDGFAAEDDTSRVVRGVAGLTLGAAEISVGVYLSTNDSKGPGYLVVAFGAGAVIGGTISFFASSPMARIASSHREGLAQGRPAAEMVERTERQWAASAHQERTIRKVLGITGLAIGVITIGAGVTFAAISTPSNLSLREQQGISAALIGVGHFTALGAVWTLVQRGTVESSYDIYKGATGRTALQDRLTVGAAPLAGGGGMGTLGLVF